MKPFIVLGARGGIGEALAKTLLSQGSNVIATARDDSTLDADIKGHPSCRTARVDVLDDASVQGFFESLDAPEGIAGMAYCIGSINLMPFRMARPEKYAEAWDLNVLGAVRVLRAGEESLRKGQGSVVLYSSIAASQGFANHAVIGPIKAAVEGLTRALAAEWTPHVRVNCIAPSLSDTPLAASLTKNEAIAAKIAASHPIPRLGTAGDSAALSAFLLGGDSGWITGQVFHVDGGRSHLRIKD